MTCYHCRDECLLSTYLSTYTVGRQYLTNSLRISLVLDKLANSFISLSFYNGDGVLLSRMSRYGDVEEYFTENDGRRIHLSNGNLFQFLENKCSDKFASEHKIYIEDIG